MVSVIGNAGISFNLVAACIAGIIAFTLLIETGKEKLEHKIKRDHPEHFFKMLEQIYHEVMVLGVISYLLFMLEQYSVLDTGDYTQLKWIVGFEFSHVMIFYMALLFVGKSVAAIMITTHAFTQWDRIEHMPFDVTLENFKKEKTTPEGLCNRLYSNFLRVNFAIGSQAKQDLEWQLMRLQFSIKINMVHKDFDFAKYMRRRLSITVAHAIHISTWTWCITGSVLVTLFLVWDASGGDDNLRNATTEETAHRRLAGGSAAILTPESAQQMVFWALVLGCVMCLGAYVLAFVLSVHQENYVMGTDFLNLRGALLEAQPEAPWDRGRSAAAKPRDPEPSRNPLILGIDEIRELHTNLTDQVERHVAFGVQKGGQHREDDFTKRFSHDDDHHQLSDWTDWLLREMASSLFLLNCFYLSLYILQVGFAVGWTEWATGMQILAHLSVRH